MVGRHDAALFHRVVQHGKGSRGAVGAADLQPHFFQNPGNAVPHGGSGRKAQIHDSEGYAQTAGRFLAHQLTHTGNLESGLFDGFGHHVKGLTLHVLQSVVHHAGAGNAHIQHALRLAHAVERTGHEGVILHGVGEHHHLGAAKAVVIRSQLGGFLDDTPHFRNGIHVDARLGGADVHAGAHPLGGSHGLGDGADQLPVSRGAALLHQSGKAADEVDAAGDRRRVQRFRDLHIGICLAGTGHDGDGRNGNPLVDNGNSEFLLDVLADLHQVFGAAGDLPINLIAAGLQIRVAAVQQTDAHGDGSDVQMPLVDHILGLQDVLLIQHGLSLKSGAWLQRCPHAARGWTVPFPCRSRPCG